MIQKSLFLSLTFSLFLFLGIVNTTQAQFGDFEVTYVCADEAAVIALIDTVFLKNIPAYAKKDITFYGNPEAVGYFKNGYFLNFPKGKGIIMSTGMAEHVDRQNNCTSQNANTNMGGISNDSDLNSLSNDPTNDGCIIEFKFKPTADTVSFNYVFGSEEYNEYTGPSDFNDVFGFFLLGDGIDGPYQNNSINIAEIPGTHLPCSIKNINIGDGDINCNPPPTGCNHCEFFRDNSNVGDPAFNKFVFDGFTTKLPAINKVTQCKWYTIRLKIADAVDAAWDTGVFLEEGSFDLGTAVSNADYTHPTIDSLVYESCNNNYVTLNFNLSTKLGFDYKLPYKVEGTATQGEDYLLQPSALVDTIFFPAGTLHDSIIIKPIYEDNIIEGIEDIQIVYKGEMCNPIATYQDTAFVYIDDKPYFGDTIKRYETYCEETINLNFGDGYLTGIEPYSYEWLESGSDESSIDYTITGADSVDVYCIVYDTCGRQKLNKARVIVPELLADAGPDLDLCNVPSVQLDGSASSEGLQNILWSSNPNDPSLAGQETIIDPVVSPSGTTEYTLTISDNCTHEDSDNTIASLDGATAAAYADNTAICIGETVELSVNPGASGETYAWTSVPADPSLIGQETNNLLYVTPTNTSTEYFVTVTNSCSFTADASIVINVNPLPTASAGSNAAICFGESFDLEGSGGEDYVWTSSPNDLSLAGQDSIYNPTVTPDQQTDYTYTVEVTDINGCVNTADMVLQVDPVPAITLDAPDPIICYGESTSISAVGNANDLTWTADPPDASLVGQENSVVITVSPLEPTTYTLVGNVAGFNCPATLSQSIDVKPELFSTFQIQENTTCENEPFYINYTGNAAPTAIYTWNFDGATINSGTGPGGYDIQWDVAGVKTISLEVEEDGCFGPAYSEQLEVIKTPIADFTSDIFSGCVPIDVAFSSSSTNLTNNVSYNWELGNNSGGTSETASTTYTVPGQYDVTLSLTNEARCSNSKTVTAYIDAFETPEADFDAVPPESILEDDAAVIEFTNGSTSDDALSYTWNFGDEDGSTSSQESPSFTYTSAGIYTVTLDIVTGNDCGSYTEKEVTIHPDFVVYAPNAFSPNGDGKNDYFEIKGIGLKAYNLQVFSRWGELIFESNNIEDQWDGKYDGEYVPTGTYVYTIKYTSMLDKNKKLEGSVTVLK